MRDGANELRRLARDLDNASVELKRELPRGMRRAAVPMVAAIRREAQETLPKRGGFADYVAASAISIRTRTSASQAGVRIVGRRRRAGGAVDLYSVNRGRLRHPIFGDRDRWRTQMIRAGFWDRGVNAHQDKVTREIERVVNGIRRKIETGD